MPIETYGSNAAISSRRDPLRPSPFTSSFATEFVGTELQLGLTTASPARTTVASGRLTLVTTTNGFFDNHVFLPISSFDTRTIFRVPAGANNANGVGPVARRQGSGATAACYVVNANYNGALTLYAINASGAPTQLAATSLGTFTPNNGYDVILETIGVSPTLLIASVQALDGTVIGTVTATDNSAVLQATPGGCGLANWSVATLSVDALSIETRSSPAVRSGIRLGFLGDSITQGVNTSGGSATLPNQTATRLAARIGLPVAPTIQAVSGTTVGDWLNSTGGANLATVKSTFAAAGVNIVSLMLGTNDSKNSVATPQSTYLLRMGQLATELLTVAGVQAVVVHGPPLHLTNGTDFNHKSLRRLQGFSDALESVCTGTDGRGILPGDFSWYGYLAANPALISDGVHPNSAACELGGDFHANAISRALRLLG